MQNRYVGDVGDFAKYGLLRALGQQAGGWEPRIAVIWCLVPDGSHNSDGRHTRYLTAKPEIRQTWQLCDPELYEGLQSLVVTGRRSVAEIESAKLLPNTFFFNTSLAFERSDSRERRATLRAEWVKGALAACAGCDLAFLDPDNGLEVKVERFSKKGPKYAYFDDLQLLADAGRSLVVYQHASRQGSVTEQIQGRLIELKERFRCREPFALRFHRVSSRSFLILPSAAHRERFQERCTAFLDSPWGAHFELVQRQSGR